MRSLTLLAVAGLVSTCPSIRAAATSTNSNPGSTAASPPPSAFESFVTDSKKPVDWLTWGADLRVRDEFVENAGMKNPPTAPHDLNQLRTRARLWTTVKPVDVLEVNARLDWESRLYTTPDEPVPVSGRFAVNSFEPDEVLLDNLSVRLTNAPVQGLALTVGRQDLMFGNGWLIGDGTPRDGSRTYFMDAARMTYDWKDGHTMFNAIYVDQGAASDRWLPPINARDYRNYLTEQNERGLILYVVNKSLKSSQIDAYFIYKNDQAVDAFTTTGARRFPTSDGYIIAFGARAQVDVTDHLRVRAEFAPEFGEKQLSTAAEGGPAAPRRDLAAFGANTLVSYQLKDRFNQVFRAGYEYLSGDDPNTSDTNERFDPLWGRWPQISELLVYNSTTGPRPVEWGNYHRFQVGYSFNPAKQLTFSLDYHAYFAPEDEVAPLNRGGDFRGHLLISQLEYVFNKHLKGHLRSEFFFPGDYYTGSANQTDMETFLRAEVFMTW
jgi:hypothetical protein